MDDSQTDYFKSVKNELAEENPEYWDYLYDGRQSRHCFMSVDGRFMYHVSIIDYLQLYNFDKWGENRLKSIYKDGEMISAVEPKKYSHRFFKFMMKNVITNQDAIDISVKEMNYDKLQRKYYKKNQKKY